jgi:hypothetical protein
LDIRAFNEMCVIKEQLETNGSKRLRCERRVKKRAAISRSAVSVEFEDDEPGDESWTATELSKLECEAAVSERVFKVWKSLSLETNKSMTSGGDDVTAVGFTDRGVDGIRDEGLEVVFRRGEVDGAGRT